MTTLTIHIVAADPVLHIWCDRCLTSAGYEVPLYAMHGMSSWRIAVVERCLRCDGGDE